MKKKLLIISSSLLVLLSFWFVLAKMFVAEAEKFIGTLKKDESVKISSVEINEYFFSIKLKDVNYTYFRLDEARIYLFPVINKAVASFYGKAGESSIPEGSTGILYSPDLKASGRFDFGGDYLKGKIDFGSFSLIFKTKDGSKKQSVNRSVANFTFLFNENFPYAAELDLDSEINSSDFSLRNGEREIFYPSSSIVNLKLECPQKSFGEFYSFFLDIYKKGAGDFSNIFKTIYDNRLNLKLSVKDKNPTGEALESFNYANDEEKINISLATKNALTLSEDKKSSLVKALSSDLRDFIRKGASVKNSDNQNIAEEEKLFSKMLSWNKGSLDLAIEFLKKEKIIKNKIDFSLDDFHFFTKGEGDISLFSQEITLGKAYETTKNIAGFFNEAVLPIALKYSSDEKYKTYLTTISPKLAESLPDFLKTISGQNFGKEGDFKSVIEYRGGQIFIGGKTLSEIEDILANIFAIKTLTAPNPPEIKG